MGLRKNLDAGIRDLKRSAADTKRSAQHAKTKALEARQLATKNGRAAARLSAQQRCEAARSAYSAALERAVDAADRNDVLAEERAISEAVAAARADKTVKREFDERWAVLLREKKLRRSKFLGGIVDMQFYRDRVITKDGAHVMDDKYRATIDAAAVRHGRGELYFLIEHPNWARVERVDPTWAHSARQLAANINLAASMIASQKPAGDGGFHRSAPRLPQRAR